MKTRIIPTQLAYNYLTQLAYNYLKQFDWPRPIWQQAYTLINPLSRNPETIFFAQISKMSYFTYIIDLNMT